MKKKIVIEVPMRNDEKRAKAMQLAAAIPGVGAVSVDKEKNQVVVIGVGVDSFKLMKSLRKKFRCAKLVTVEEVKEEKKVEKKEEKKEEKKDEKFIPFCQPCGNPPDTHYYYQIYDPNPTCHIL